MHIGNSARTWAAAWIAVALLAACGGDDGNTATVDTRTAPEQPAAEQPGKGPDKRPDPVLRCAP